jgi:hypothetical protein
MGRTLPARNEPSACRDTLGDELADLLVLSSVDERAKLGAGIKTVSDRNASCALDQPPQQSISDALLYDQTRCRAADLPLVAYAMIVHAESGFDRSLMRYAGDRDRPAAGAIFVADVLGGIFGYSAIQTALVQR